VQEALGKRHQPYKFSLIELAQHREVNVGECINNSIAEYLSTKSFSDIGEVTHFLGMIQLQKADFEDLFPCLEELMKRRHRLFTQPISMATTVSNREYYCLTTQLPLKFGPVPSRLSWCVCSQGSMLLIG
jgi:hypothetical protein